jgi:hypothetical protein
MRVAIFLDYFPRFFQLKNPEPQCKTAPAFKTIELEASASEPGGEVIYS